MVGFLIATALDLLSNEHQVMSSDETYHSFHVIDILLFIFILQLIQVTQLKSVLKSNKNLQKLCAFHIIIRDPIYVHHEHFRVWLEYSSLHTAFLIKALFSLTLRYPLLLLLLFELFKNIV